MHDDSPEFNYGKGKWKQVSRLHPCPACGGHDRCGFGARGAISCFRTNVAPQGMRLVVERGGAAIFRPEAANGNGSRGCSARRPATSAPTVRPTNGHNINWTAEYDAARAKMTPERNGELAATLGVPASAIEGLAPGFADSDDLKRWRAGGAGWTESPPDCAFVFAERDDRGRIVGLALRTLDGRKGFPLGAKRGLTIPANIHAKTDPVLIVEGASDVVACEALGLTAVGRPSNAGGAEMLAKLLDGREVLIVGENDFKEGGAWPGRDGAKSVARRIATECGEAVRWTLPPNESKDVRAWLNARAAEGLILADADACRAAGVELLGALKSTSLEAKPEAKPSQSEMIVRLALERYRLGMTTDGEPFAVEIDGLNVARMFRGSETSLRAILANEYRQRTGRTPKSAALADALNVLAGQAIACESEPAFMRIAEHDDSIVLDLGRKDGMVVMIRPGVGWEVSECSPVLFRRTALSGEFPIPVHDGGLDELRGLLNVTDDSWPLVLGCLLAAFIPAIPHPILLCGGEQGTAKTSAARLLLRCFDPGPILEQSSPRDLEQWAVTAAGRWGVLLDNVSSIPQWLSDALCRAVTGDGFPRRLLWTNSDISVLVFKRVILMTSIDPGAIKGDLGERLVLADFEPIDDVNRRTEEEIKAAFKEAYARILGALLTTVSAILDRLKTLRLAKMPRMADFSRVLAAMDNVLNTDALGVYVSQGGRVALDVLEADPVAASLIKLVRERGEWSGTAGELLNLIRPQQPDKDWPKFARGMGGILRRLAAPLRKIGLDVRVPRPKDKTREYSLRAIRRAVSRFKER